MLPLLKVVLKNRRQLLADWSHFHILTGILTSFKQNRHYFISSRLAPTPGSDGFKKLWGRSTLGSQRESLGKQGIKKETWVGKTRKEVWKSSQPHRCKPVDCNSHIYQKSLEPHFYDFAPLLPLFPVLPAHIFQTRSIPLIHVVIQFNAPCRFWLTVKWVHCITFI